MISKLVEALHNIELELTAEEIADTLWLASHIAQAYQVQGEKLSQTVEASEEPEPVPLANPLDVEDVQYVSPDGLEFTSSEVYPDTRRTSEVSGVGPGVRPSRIPAARALPGALDMALCLRPLIRRIPSRVQSTLDEVATADNIAEQGIWFPILKPAMVHWLEIALIIDEGASMVIWRQTIAELRLLFERLGAFRDVRIWGMVTDKDNGRVGLHEGTGMTARTKPARSPRELLDSHGQRLILVISDCVSRAWHNGAAQQMLAMWGQTNPVAILQVLPQRLWSRTALGDASRVNLYAPFPGVPNRRIRSQSLMYSFIEEPPSNDESSLRMPVVTLEPVSLHCWACMLAGEAIWVPGFLLDANHTSKNQTSAQSDGLPLQLTSISAVERVQRFRAIASPEAYKLAGLLSVAPISLPVVRLIQQTMMPKSSQTYSAEVFLGGLLQKLPSDIESVDPDYMQYDFVEGVREVLQNSVPVTEAMQVFRKVSEFIEEHSGQSFDFSALIADPNSPTRISINEGNRSFASITGKYLRRLGRKYEALADQLEGVVRSQDNRIVQRGSVNIPIDDKEQPPIGPKIPATPEVLPLRSSGGGNLLRKSYCFFCGKQFYLGDCAIIASQSQTVLRPAPQGIRRLISRLWVSPLKGPFYTMRFAARQCPNCQKLLPPNMGFAQNIIIAVLGDITVGKTHYIAACIDQMSRGGPLRHFNEVEECLALNQEVEQKYRNTLYDPLFRDLTPLPATRSIMLARTEEEKLNDPLIYRLGIRKAPFLAGKEYNLIFYDASGEDLADQQILVKYKSYALDPDAIIYIVDPLAIPSIEVRTPFNKQTTRTPAYGLRWITDLIKRYKRARPGELLSIPVAITLSKSDLLAYLEPVDVPFRFLEEPTYINGLDLNDIEEVDREVKVLLERYGEGDLLATRRLFENISFFATSATGCAPNPDTGRFDEVKPLRCLDPLLWILFKLGVINMKEDTIPRLPS